jgi:hypothetical protein
MDSAEYISVLENSLQPFLARNNNVQWTFQHDNAAIHTSRQTKTWLGEHAIDVLEWPDVPQIKTQWKTCGDC